MNELPWRMRRHGSAYSCYGFGRDLSTLLERVRNQMLSAWGWSRSILDGLRVRRAPRRIPSLRGISPCSVRAQCVHNSRNNHPKCRYQGRIGLGPIRFFGRSAQHYLHRSCRWRHLSLEAQKPPGMLPARRSWASKAISPFNYTR